MDDRRRLPAIDRLVKDVADRPRAMVVREARALVAAVRGGATMPEDWSGEIRARVDAAAAPSLRRVINATGVVLHTNLGRAPLSAEVAASVAAAAQGYVNLEIDLATGARGDRLGGVGASLARLGGAEAAMAVNNNAAAVLLLLTALAAGKEVIVSRGELVEIGGSFRVPEVIAAGGARLVEVGTTNRTRTADYAAAITSETAAILRVHPSNFRVVGFTETPERRDLAALARERGLLFLEDLGSGAVVPGLGEPTVAEVVATGADVVCFSGDKLFGGPQSGLVVGRAECVSRMRRHPLYRALRLDRLVLAALEATLRAYERGDLPPAITLLRDPPERTRARAVGLAGRLKAAGVVAGVEADEGEAGAGSLPGRGLPTTVLTLHGGDALAAALRSGTPAVLARVAGGVVRVDPRTVLPDEEDALIAAIVGACGRAPGA